MKEFFLVTWEIPLEPQGVNEWKSIYFFYKFRKGLKKYKRIKGKCSFCFMLLHLLLKTFYINNTTTF